MTHRGPFQPLPFCDSVNLCWFSHRRMFHLFHVDVLGIASIPGVLLERHMLSTPLCAWSCALMVQSLVKNDKRARTPGPGASNPRTWRCSRGYPPCRCRSSLRRGKMMEHQSPHSPGEVGAVIPAKHLLCGAPVEGPWLCRAARGGSGDCWTARKAALSRSPFPEGGSGAAETQT